jgi:uncharacterized protein (DUF1697 family)
MADLRAAAESCGYEHVRTYIQSGNLLLATGAAPNSVAHELRRAIAEQTDVDPLVIVRTRDELVAVVDANPFLGRGADPAHLHVVFLSEQATLGSIDEAAYTPEEAVAAGREVYLLLPNGIGRSRLATDLARGSAASGTTRSWRTVTKLLALAEEGTR